MAADRLGEAALRRHHIGVKTKGVRFRGAHYVFRYSAGHYEVFLDEQRVMSLATRHLLEAIAQFKQQL
ncbi:hypothetical protein LU196_14490 [Pantoea sp. Mb-10]|uniref:hypothetical protein n=1 Tax=unclassified Pantoea TaxID=2630326 RepID=UPI001E3407C9|nr:MULTISPECIES: hypothetical protein [unclassified Pantoea]MCE0491253.1 hypothetical protein [Pantoea sp. Mb-10]MCE0502742.1 hypothetical protein [Pantoea sp. Pb-8]